MQPLTEKQVRASFVNASKGEVQRLNLPDLDAIDWDRVDLLGWVDPKAPLAAHLVVETDDGPVGVLLRRNPSGAGPRRARMCSLCTTTHAGQGVALMVARRAGKAGRDGNTRGPGHLRVARVLGVRARPAARPGDDHRARDAVGRGAGRPAAPQRAGVSGTNPGITRSWVPGVLGGPLLRESH